MRFSFGPGSGMTGMKSTFVNKTDLNRNQSGFNFGQNPFTKRHA